MRPLLNPGLRRVWRSPDTLQFGVDVAQPVILSGCDDATARLLDTLDGARSIDDIIASVSEAEREHVTRTLTTVTSTPAVIDGTRWPGGRSLTVAARARLAPDLARALTPGATDADVTRHERLASTGVMVHGVGRLGAVVAGMLAGAGVGRIDLVDEHDVTDADVCAGGHQPRDVGRRRVQLVERLAAWQVCKTVPPSCSLAVVTDDCDARATCDVLCRQSMPHLVVSCSEQIGRVGPFVLPGRSACLRCYDFTRTDHDSDWPTIVLQLGSARQPPLADGQLVNVTASIAVTHLINLLTDDTPPSVNGFVEFWQPCAEARPVRLLPHPSCGCTWPEDPQDTMVG